MAKIDGLTLEVKLDVSDEMAAACVAILNLYLKENDVVDVITEKMIGIIRYTLSSKQLPSNNRRLLFIFGD